MATMKPSGPASGADGGSAALNGIGIMPLVGLIVRPFPEPGPTIRTAMEQLQQTTIEPTDDEEALRKLTQLPRPWDPGTCTDHQIRAELWTWLDQVAMWVNEQHLWTVTRPGIPECWPAHPHIVHDMAVLACSRYYTKFAATPAALEDWHRYGLPGFLERLQGRLGDGCQPGKHQPRPRNERDQTHTSASARQRRTQRYRDDVDRSAALAAASAVDDVAEPHQRW